VNPELITLVYRLTPDSRGILPKKAQAVLEKLKLWNWGSVLSKTTVWSLAYLVLQVIYVYIYIYIYICRFSPRPRFGPSPTSSYRCVYEYTSDIYI